MSNYEILTLVVLTSSSLFVGVSLLYLAKQVRLFISAHADNHEWNRRIETQKALDKIRDINTDSLNEAFGYVNRKAPIPLEDILKEFNNNHSLQLLLNKLLNFYEGLANGVFMGIYDEASIKANRRGPMEREIIRCRNYIEHRRNENSKTVWSAYERLIKKWSEEELNSSDRSYTGKI